MSHYRVFTEDESESSSDSSSDTKKRKRNCLTENQEYLLAMQNSRREEIKRIEANEKEEENRIAKENQDLLLALSKSHQEEIERQRKEIERQQIEHDPKRIEQVYDEFVKLLLSQYHQHGVFQQDYEIWPAFSRLIVGHDYSMFLDYIIPSIASFWKSRDYEIDQKYGLSIVQPKIILEILDLRTRLIKFMKDNYSPRGDEELEDEELEELDIGEWPISKVCWNSGNINTIYLKPYEEKWNVLFSHQLIREHFKQQIFEESLFLIGALYNFFKYTKEVNLIKYK